MKNCMDIMICLAELYVKSEISKEDLKPLKKEKLKNLLQPEAKAKAKAVAKPAARRAQRAQAAARPHKRPAAAPAPGDAGDAATCHVKKKPATANPAPGLPEAGAGNAGPEGDVEVLSSDGQGGGRGLRRRARSPLPS